MANLSIRNLQKGFDGHQIIKGIDLDVKDREFVVFVGPSGCGKSTLLRLIAGLEEVTSGTIELDGRDITQVTPAKRDLAMVFQTYALYPHMTVGKNLSFALDLAGRVARTDPTRTLTVAQGVAGDDDLRHPRSGRSHDAGRQSGGAQWRQGRAGRLSAGAVSPPGQPVRGRFSRHTENGLPQRQNQPGERRRVRSRTGRRHAHQPAGQRRRAKCR